MWKEIQAEDMQWSLFPNRRGNWFLVTAGREGHCNSLLVNLGGLLSLWSRSCVAVLIRESRYTKEFLDQEEHFSVAVLPESLKEAQSYMGHHSGRNEDKWAESGLTPVMLDGVPAPEEARLVLLCRKLCACPLSEVELPEDIAVPHKDGKGSENPHVIYIGEVQKILVKE